MTEYTTKSSGDKITSAWANNIQEDVKWDAIQLGPGTNYNYLIDDDRILMVARKQANEKGKFMLKHRVHYGTYEWTGKISGTDQYLFYYMMGLEEWNGVTTNLIELTLDGTTYNFKTRKAGTDTSTGLTGQDWTTERTFKIVWTATDVTLYIDDVQKAQHGTLYTPTVKLVPFIELFTNASNAPAINGKLWIGKEFGNY